MHKPLVTLGVPVRNGAATLAAALDSCVGQDYPNLEVIISDNASSDATPEIARSYADRYPFVRIVRQDDPLTAIDNFLFVMNEARGKFFMWCAHDDTRSPDFVSSLLPAFDDPATVLAFGDLYICDGRSTPRKREDYDFVSEGLCVRERLYKAANVQCYHIYGLWRLSALRAIRYRYTHWWSDLPIMLAASAIGCFHYVKGPEFRYFEIAKTAEERAPYQDNRVGNSRIKNFSALYSSILVTVGHTAGIWPAFLSFAFVSDKYIREALRRVRRKVGVSY
jgi:glycosyltransferase involved in cell wall biosynthesis